MPQIQPKGFRVFILHLKSNVNVKEFRKIMEGAVSANAIRHFFTIPQEEIGIVDVDSQDAARKIQGLFHGQEFCKALLEVKIMGHRAKVWVGRLCPAVSNEYLKRAFETFGSVQRARVVANSNGSSAKWGFVEFDDAASAQKAVETCDEHCFMLTRSGPPVQVEFWNEVDEYYGVREKFCAREGESEKEISIAPRLAEQGAFEYDFAKRWKELAEEEQLMKEELQKKVLDKRRALLQEHRKALNEEESRRLRFVSQRQQMPVSNSKVNPYYQAPLQQQANPFPPAPAPRIGVMHSQVIPSPNLSVRSPHHPNFQRITSIPPTQPAGFPNVHPGLNMMQLKKRKGMPPPPTNARMHIQRHHPYR